MINTIKYNVDFTLSTVGGTTVVGIRKRDIACP